MSSKEEADLLVKSRVEQLDALELDKEVLCVLKSQVSSATKFLPLSFQNNWGPEVDTLLQIVILQLSVRGAGSTFGQQLLNIKFLKSQQKTALLATLVPILVKYFHTRASDIAIKIGSDKLKQIFETAGQWGDISVTAGSLINLLMFLHSGYYPNLLYRLFGIQMSYSSPKARQRQVGYTHMTRELIWHSFIELLVFVLPLINYHYIKRIVLRILMLGSTGSKLRPGTRNKVSLTLNSKCAVCSKRPIIPHHMDCVHVFCYFCLQANILADPNFACPECGTRASGISSAKPVCMTVM
ncbi:Peroxisome biogenesis factor 2 [Frankliniella fusca]|uniref:Peroxisome biogenesis factor 2 n=1 Tax=Frankliniella fusca TaxID=407009 RepID=A0AAE1HAB2_9NEOP|nr:Peroxisome biogenesis factor 2 [Frankliniella fusca]